MCPHAPKSRTFPQAHVRVSVPSAVACPAPTIPRTARCSPSFQASPALECPFPWALGFQITEGNTQGPLEQNRALP